VVPATAPAFENSKAPSSIAPRRRLSDGVTDQGQISKLLARLARLGLYFLGHGAL
jgi:hypothetical protein